jgi:hypothetical protein
VSSGPTRSELDTADLELLDDVMIVELVDSVSDPVSESTVIVRR